MDIPHIPVLLKSVLDSFRDTKEGYVVDCTLGYGGHSSEILKKYPKLKLIGIDRDQEALDFSSKRLSVFKDRVELIKGDFASIVPTLSNKPVAALLADFGVSSLQLDKAERGFGFESDTLDMRMDRTSGLSAYDVINSYSYEQLRYIFSTYGELKEASRLAEEIIKVRSKEPISSAVELSNISKRIIRGRQKIHPATLVFQAVRIEVNDELGQIEGLLDSLEKMRPSGAIVSLITFHSLEDRLIKHRFQEWAKSCICDPNAYRCTCGNDHSLGTIRSRKPIVASSDEILANPRSRSAKLRTFVFEEHK